MLIIRRPLVALFIVLVTACWVSARPGHAQSAADNARDSARLIEVLDLRAGSAVADVGAGSGALVPAIAKQVGPTGQLFATDVNGDRIKELRTLAEKESLKQVTVLQAGELRTNLPDACCDAIFMRLVYHHFGEPAAMNASLKAALKPGGRLAVVDFPPKSGLSAPAGKRASGDAHGVTAETVIEELTAAGFTDVKTLPWTDGTGFLVVARRDR